MSDNEFEKENIDSLQEETEVMTEMQEETTTEPEEDIQEEETVRSREKAVTEKEAKLTARHYHLTAKERALEQQQIYMDTLCAELTGKKRQICTQEIDLKKQKQELDEFEQDIQQRLEAVERRETAIKETAENLNKLSSELDERENQLRQRETTEQAKIAEMRLQAQDEIRQQKDALAVELQKKRTDGEREIEEHFAKLRDELRKELDGMREKHRKSCAERTEQVEKEIEQKRTDAEKEIRSREESINTKDRELKAREEKLHREQEDVDFERELNQSNKKKLNDERRRIDGIVEDKLAEKRKIMEAETASLHEEVKTLLSKLNLVEHQNCRFEQIIAKYGSDPDIIQEKFNKKQEELDRLHEQVLNFNQNKADDYDRLSKDNENMKDELSQVRSELANAQLALEETDNLRNQITRLNTQVGFLQQEIETHKGEIRKRNEIIDRLQTPEEQRADREQRIREIKNGHLPVLLPEMREEYRKNQPENEIEWLGNIENKCIEYGITIPRRILYAFHTALKIADWSTVAVLAGVSGTGKSELPNLYALFGGINFINVPVQPNWDSQEAMLGYFNSIDNRFEAQEILRFLAQCTDDEQYGEYMAIVLLDEMNLAHVELYFAEFLSKLEERRGRKDVPSVEVKLGAGIEPYEVKMERNILWTGTMNQDETTKSLSDKVLDRGIVINFPRPTALKSRPKMKNKNRFRNKVLLRYDTWKQWRSTEVVFEGKQHERIEKYRGIVNQINDLLEKVGRALGHRVWQSIEYYIANYPAVMAAQKKIAEMAERGDLEKGAMTGELASAMKNAFEDQIVQKIMPKLRGIETSGNSGTQLLAIKALLDREDFNALDDDFDNAMELGYGQFMWSSAKYLEKDESSLSDTEESADEISDNT